MPEQRIKLSGQLPSEVQMALHDLDIFTGTRMGPPVTYYLHADQGIDIAATLRRVQAQFLSSKGFKKGSPRATDGTHATHAYDARDADISPEDLAALIDDTLDSVGLGAPKSDLDISAHDLDTTVRDALDKVFGADENPRPGETPMQTAFRTHGHSGLKVRN